MEKGQDSADARVLEPKSVLLARHKELVEQSDDLVQEMQKREYQIEFGNYKVYKKLIKFLEKDAEWSHQTAAGLIMLYNNLMESKGIANKADWDGVLALRSANVGILWKMLIGMKGNGFYEARNFVELMMECGEQVSKSMQQVHADNQELRDMHTDIAKIEQDLNMGNFEDDTDEELEINESLANEVDPVV